MNEIQLLNEKVDALEKWKQEIDIYNVKNGYELKELIVNAVAEGQKETLQELGKIKNRVEKLENDAGKKALEELKSQRAIKTQFLVSVAIIIITAIISFFSGIVLNSMSDTKTVNQKVQEQVQYKEGK